MNVSLTIPRIFEIRLFEVFLATSVCIFVIDVPGMNPNDNHESKKSSVLF